MGRAAVAVGAVVGRVAAADVAVGGAATVGADAGGVTAAGVAAVVWGGLRAAIRSPGKPALPCACLLRTLGSDGCGAF